MKRFIFAAIAAATLMVSTETYADCDLQSCTTTISSDSGTARQCTAQSQFTCICSSMPSDCGMGTELRSTCSGSWGWVRNYGPKIGGTLNCCGYKLQPGNECQMVREAAGLSADWEQEKTSVETTAEGGLEDTFQPELGMQTTYYWGFQDQTRRSPANGRTTSAKAKLDACLFETDVDAIESLGGTDADKYGYCSGSTYGCGSTMKNEHCNNNGAAVCVDRCACVYPNNGSDTCNGL